MPRTRKSKPTAIEDLPVSEWPVEVRLRLEYAGKCVAWSQDGKRIVASADDPKALREAIRRSGETRTIYEYIPPISERPIDPDR